MRFLFIKTITFFTIFLVFSSISINAQENNYLTLNDILVTLKFPSQTTTIKELNKQLVEAIKIQKVDFLLDDINKRELKKAGASKLLISTIRKNLPSKIKTLILKKQYQSEKLSLEQILTLLKKSKDKNISPNNSYKKLKFLVCRTDVEFKLNTKNLKKLRKAGANEALINSLDFTTHIQKLYLRFINKYPNDDLERLNLQLNAAKEYIKIVESNICEEKADFQPYIDYFNDVIPTLEEQIKYIKKNKNPSHPLSPRRKRYRTFNKSFETQKWKTLFKVGDEIIKKDPAKIDVSLLLASVNFDKFVKTNKSNEKTDRKTIYYAKLAIRFIQEGKETSTNYGLYKYIYKTNQFSDGKSNALGRMNYIIGYVNYHKLHQKDIAVDYFRKALEYNSEIKKFEEINKILGKNSK